MKRQKLKITLSTKIAAVSLVILFAIGIFWVLYLLTGGENDLPVLGEPGHVAGKFSFINQDGNPITEKSVRDKVTVVEYFFTSCPSICPVMNEHLKQVYEKYKDNPDFMILSHTVDPERDSVPVLNKYAKRFDGITPGWQFLTGDKKALYDAAIRDYLLSAVDSGSSNFIHTQFVALLDKRRRIRGFYDFTKKENVSRIDEDVQALLKEGPRE